MGIFDMIVVTIAIEAHFIFTMKNNLKCFAPGHPIKTCGLI